MSNELLASFLCLHKKYDLPFPKMGVLKLVRKQQQILIPLISSSLSSSLRLLPETRKPLYRLLYILFYCSGATCQLSRDW